MQKKKNLHKRRKKFYKESSDENEKKIIFIFWSLYQKLIQFYFENKAESERNTMVMMMITQLAVTTREAFFMFTVYFPMEKCSMGYLGKSCHLKHMKGETRN